MKYDEIYREYAEIVYKYMLSICGDHHLAEELTEEAFFRAMRSKGYEPGAKISTWLCAIAKNAYISYLRKSKRRSSADISEMDISSDEDMLEGVSCTEIYKAVHSLEEPYREIILLRMHSDMSYAQIGDVFGKSENWERGTFFRGKERLRKILEERDFEI